MLPRALLMSLAPSFMKRSSFLPIIPRVRLVSGTCRETTSDSRRTSSSETCSALPSGSCLVTSQKMTRMPRVSASTLTCVPMRPYPTMPSVVPRTSCECAADFCHDPVCMSELSWKSLRCSAMMSERV